MNWTSEEGRALLWRAYPSGYLAMRGVRTLGGWQCLQPPASVHSTWAHLNIMDGGGHASVLLIPRGDGTTFVRGLAVLGGGDLLPLPDPNDPATWACLLADLSDALGWPRDTDGGGLSFGGDEGTGCWTLRGEKHTRREHSFAGIDTEDPAEALVRARVQVRERERE